VAGFCCWGNPPIGGLITAAMMEVIDTTIVNAAKLQMAGNLGATQ
jgi:hypothetical protein